ncbi:Branched-chain-amino-acid aminotransferase 2 [compost metagenome]
MVQAHKEGRLTEAFGAGTAATIAHIAKIGYRDEDLILPPIESRTFSLKVHAYLDDLKAGKVEDTFGWLCKI